VFLIYFFLLFPFKKRAGGCPMIRVVLGVLDFFGWI